MPSAHTAQPYAIDFEVVACGKAIPNSKRRIRWRYGFADPAALAAGETGSACRGAEHDVTLVWSVYSGKSVLLADGDELNYDSNAVEGTEHSWNAGGHAFGVTARGKSLFGSSSGQYSFSVDGNDFSTFAKIDQLGMAGQQETAIGSSGSRIPGENRRMRQEDAELHVSARLSIAAHESNPHDGESVPPKRMLSAQTSRLLIEVFDDFECEEDLCAFTAAAPPPPRSATDYDVAVAVPAGGIGTAALPPPARAADFDLLS